MKVSNGKCIRTLSHRSLRANRTRNIVAVLAIALTTVLFTSLFTIAMSINDGIQQNNFRQVGGFSHGGFKYLTEEQFDQLKDDPSHRSVGPAALSDTLLAARENPQEYADLLVRVAGYSAYFTQLSEDVQQDIIERTEEKLYP